MPYYSGIISQIKRVLWIFKNFFEIFFRNFDAIFILDSSKASLLLSKLLRIPKIIGSDCLFYNENKFDPFSRYYTDKIIFPKTNNSTHVAIRFQNIIKSFFGIYNNAIPVLPNSQEYAQKAESLIRNKYNVNIALCVKGSKLSLNLWHIENFKKVISCVTKYFNNNGISFYLVGNKDIFEYSQQAVVNNNTYNICGKTSLLELREFLSKMNLLISSDNGVIHIAATTKTKIISLHGATSYANTGPLTHNASPFYKQVFCSPCQLVESSKCPSYPEQECFKRIMVEEVINVALKILNEQRN
jgi:heptosyltransferase-2